MLDILPIDAITSTSSPTTIAIVIIVGFDPRLSLAVTIGSEVGRAGGVSRGVTLNLRNHHVTPYVQVLIIILLLLLLLLILCIGVREARKVIKPRQCLSWRKG